jgi:5-methylcytosine-specific restriction endonuclease McrA
LLSWHGDGVSCLCFSCGEILLYSTLQADRIIPGVLGGGYARGNIRPSCGACNRRGGNLVKRWLREGIPKPEILRRCRVGDFT